jgi:hypothetical protein
LFAIGGGEAAKRLVDALPAVEMQGEELALWALVQGLIAEGEGEIGQAAALAAQGLTALPTAELSQTGQVCGAMLSALASRRGGVGVAVNANNCAGTGLEGTNSSIAYHLPDVEWLRNCLRGVITNTLEDALARRPRPMVDELAKRLGEAQPSNLSTDAIVRRLATRLRSLPLAKVVRLLSKPARDLLSWLAGVGQVSLPTAADELATSHPEAAFWIELEALFRSGLVDVGYEIVPAQGVPTTPEQVVLLVPTDIRTRLVSVDGV